MPNENPFVPYLAKLKEVSDLTADIKLMGIEIIDPAIRENFKYESGQFGFLSVFGVGEAPFGVSSVVNDSGIVEFAVRRIGTVTAALHEIDQGSTLGVRGPFGNSFPLDDYKGKNIFIIGGGIGMAPLRPVITTIINNRSDYKDLTVLNGARSPSDLVFADEFDIWAKSPNTKVELTVDRGDDDWKGRVDLIPTVVTDLNPSPKDMIAIICGPPIMIHFTLIELKKLGFEDKQIVTTLESKMKCGLGKCARCNVGDKYICKDGPVFNLEQISQFLEQF